MARGRNDYETAQIQGRLWTPAVLRPAFWLDASDASTVTIVSGGVSEWRDKSGNGRNLSESTNRPSYSFEKRNRLNVISFSNSSQQNLTVTGLSIAMTQQSTFAVASTDGSGANARLWTQADANADDQDSFNAHIPIWASYGGSTQWGSFAATTFRSGYAVVQGKLSLFASVLSSSNLTNYYDSVPATPYNTTYPGRTFTRFGVTQSLSSGTQKLVGDVGEVLVFFSALSQQDRQRIEGYTAWKWAISLAAGHPFVNRPPLIGD